MSRTIAKNENDCDNHVMRLRAKQKNANMLENISRYVTREIDRDVFTQICYMELRIYI